MDPEKIAERLRKLRGERTLDEVSKATGIGRSAMGMYETGQRIPRDEVKIKLAQYYNKTIEEIFFAD